MIAAVVQLLFIATRYRSKLKVIPLVVVTLIGLLATLVYYGLAQYPVNSSASNDLPVKMDIATMELISCGFLVVYYKGRHYGWKSDIMQTLAGVVMGIVYMISVLSFLLNLQLIDNEVVGFGAQALFTILLLLPILIYRRLWVFFTVSFLVSSATFLFLTSLLIMFPIKIVTPIL